MSSIAYDVEITFNDGVQEIVPGVDDVFVKDDVLHIWFRGFNQISRQNRHLGSYPLVGIRRYRIVE